ncbi:MAG TPA: hypothetical protein PLX56_08060 [bacterium]|nr:hypothetical protein [bacterium]HQO92266.1 hypothetical protein [bacterium]
MKIFKKIAGSNIGISGLIILILSIFSIIYTLYVREESFREFEKFKVEEHCFQGDKSDPEWEKMSPEERKLKSDKCMTGLNKLTQIKFGPYIFSFTLIAGIFLLVTSMIKAGKEDDDDNKLS